MVVFRDWIFSLFSPFIWSHDTEFVNGKGLFQRYIEIFGDEIDELIIPKIQAFPDIIQVLTTEDKYLVYLTEFLGNPPTMFYSDVRYRRLLRYLMDINKHKGTRESYEMIFSILGCTITLEEIRPPVMRYDYPEVTGGFLTPKRYDEGYLYDEECPSCSSYNLYIEDPNRVLDGVLTNPVLYNLLMKVIKYVEPINMKLSELTINSTPIGTADEWVLTTGIWDDGLFWNDMKIYKDTP